MLIPFLLGVAFSRRLRRGNSIVLPEDDISQADAVAKLPLTLRALFQDAAASKDETKAEKVMKELDKIYERAMMDKDLLDIDCVDKKEHYAVKLKTGRMMHQQSEATLTRVELNVEHAQQKSDDVEARIQQHTSQFHEHKYMCDEHRIQSEKELKLLQKDKPVSKKLREKAAAGCASLSLLECEHEDGTIAIAFEDKELKKLANSLTLDGQQFINLNLERAVYGHEPLPSSFLTFQRSQYTRKLQRDKKKAVCTKVKAPSCEAFVDVMGTFVGNVEDAIDELQEKIVTDDRKCQDGVASDEDAIKVERQQISDLNVELSSGVEEAEEARGEEHRMLKEWEDLSQEAKTSIGTCTGQLRDIEETLCGIRRLRKDLKKLNLAKEVPFIGDCAVTDWIRGPCTEICAGGFQNITREVIADAPLCPPLVIKRKCNEGPCPTDCRMGYWGKWSRCSKECGGGTQSRIRDIEEEAKNGGLPCGDTVQERMCNHQSCDQECVLSEWSDWSGCSRSCLKGHQVRTKTVLMAARGVGLCPDERSHERMERRRCNNFECSTPTPKCNSTVDLVIALDSSGSVGAAGFAKAKGFLDIFAPRFNDRAKLALVDFGTAAELIVPLGNKDGIVGALSSLTWRKTNTNTADALGVTEEALLAGRRKAQSVVLVITDGMPYSKHATGLMIKRLKADGARIMFLTVGEALNRRLIKQWASWPSYDNVEKVPSYEALNATIATNVVAKMCSQLEK